MKKTNRAKVKALAHNIKSGISDQKFFTAKSTVKVLFNMVKGIMLRFTHKFVKIYLVWQSPAVTGYTDNKDITINANCDIFDGLNRPEKWLAIKGMVLHEVSHILYTNKDYFLSVMDNLELGRLLPQPSDEVTSFDLKDRNFLMLYKMLWNSLEDGYIEYQFLADFVYEPYREALMSLRQIHINSFDTFEEMVDKEARPEDKLLTILNLLLCYCKYGKLLVDKSHRSDERCQALICCMPYINEYNNNDSVHERFRALNEIVLILEDYIADYLNAVNSGDNTGDGLSEMAQQNSQDASSGTSGQGAKQEAKQEETGQKPEKPENAPPRPASTDDEDESEEGTGNGTDEDESESDEEGDGVSSGADEDESDDGVEEAETEGDDEADKDEFDNGEAEANSEGESEDSSMLNPQRLSFGESSFDEALAKAEGNVEKQELEAEISSTLEREMEQISNSLAEEIAEEQLEDEKIQALRDFDNTLDYGPLHNGVDCTINAISVSESDVEYCEELLKDAEKVGKTTARHLNQVLKDRRNGGVQKGLYFGKSLCPTSYTRQDKRYFQNKKLPTENPTLSVALVIDESGSMNGERMNYARFMSLVTYEFCQQLGINLMIVGHTTRYTNEVQLYQYVDFGGGFDGKDKYRLLSMSAKGCNRDGYALKYAIERTKRQSTDMKLVIIVSDGQPNDDGYCGQVAYDDLYKQKQDARKAGVDVIAAAIGDDKEIIQGIYGSGYLNISNLKMLPKAITDTIKKYLPMVA